MTLKARVTRLEDRRRNRGNPLADLTDDELDARIAAVRSQLVALGEQPENLTLARLQEQGGLARLVAGFPG